MLHKLLIYIVDTVLDEYYADLHMGSRGMELKRAADSQGLPTFHPEVMTIFTNKARECCGFKIYTPFIHNIHLTFGMF